MLVNSDATTRPEFVDYSHTFVQLALACNSADLHTALHTPTPPNQNLLESHCDRLASPRGFEALLTGLEADADMPNATGIRLVA